MQKYLMLISLSFCLSNFASSILAQPIYPDSVGQMMTYNALIEMKKGYVSGICVLVNNGEEVTASMFNEFGISALDFSYYPPKNKVKLHNVVSFLNKWYIKRVLRKDLPRLLRNLQLGVGEYYNVRHGITYKLYELDYEAEE